MKNIWIAKRRHATMGQSEFLGYFGTRRKAVDAVLVAAQNDFSINQRWPELQVFYDIDVTVEGMTSHFVWLTAVSGTREKGYIVNRCAVH